jgi:putative transposase
VAKYEMLKRAGSLNTPRSYWFVGASYGGNDDQTDRFLSEGKWHNGYRDRYLGVVRSMQPGDKIAIKSCYTRKKRMIALIQCPEGASLDGRPVNRDHVHMLLSIPPNLSVSRAVQYLKGKSSHKLLSEFSVLKRRYWGQHLWARGYWVASSGNVTDEVWKEYIKNQRPLEPDDNFTVE